jgi:hypothetical protein
LQPALQLCLVEAPLPDRIMQIEAARADAAFKPSVSGFEPSTSHAGQIGNGLFSPRADLYSEWNESPVWGILTHWTTTE